LVGYKLGNRHNDLFIFMGGGVKKYWGWGLKGSESETPIWVEGGGLLGGESSQKP